MTEQTMVGRVADAICSESVAWLKAPLCRMAYEDMARAAIGTMRKPTAAMLEAFDAAAPMYDDFPTSGESYWDDGIDAALEEPEPKGRKA